MLLRLTPRPHRIRRMVVVEQAHAIPGRSLRHWSHAHRGTCRGTRMGRASGGNGAPGIAGRARPFSRSARPPDRLALLAARGAATLADTERHTATGPAGADDPGAGR